MPSFQHDYPTHATRLTITPHIGSAGTFCGVDYRISIERSGVEVVVAGRHIGTVETLAAGAQLRDEYIADLLDAGLVD
jgi:hypothetical protein